MENQVEACRESAGRYCSVAHIGACAAAISLLVLLVAAKLGGWLPIGVGPVRVTLWTALTYGFVFAAMHWKLGRAIKRSRLLDEAALPATPVASPLI
jgi:hypothetical protein